MNRNAWLPIVMLAVSNVFMTYAWYGHLKDKGAPLWRAILVSWGIAFLEYCLMVPANRWGSATYEPYQLSNREIWTVAHNVRSQLQGDALQRRLDLSSVEE